MKKCRHRENSSCFLVTLDWLLFSGSSAGVAVYCDWVGPWLGVRGSLWLGVPCAEVTNKLCVKDNESW